MKIKVSTAEGAVLNWMVATAEKHKKAIDSSGLDGPLIMYAVNEEHHCKTGLVGQGWYVFAPSTDWAQGGPIIEREYIEMHTYSENDDGIVTWRANDFMDGPNPLIAAMRCYVASKLGDEVEVPDELGSQ